MANPVNAANTYSDPNGLAALKRDPNSPQARRAVAQQVDALFMQMMLKSMRDASAAAGESESNEMGMYQDMFDKQIALTLSQHQGLGLGTLLNRELGAGGDRKAPPPAAAPTAPIAARAAAHAADFIEEVMPSIRTASQALGLNPLAIVAQAALETGWGTRMPRTPEGKPSLNLFGIKADEKWAGARAEAGTVEYSSGLPTERRAVFRAYGSIEESVRDFAALLQNSPRYAAALNAGADAAGYAERIGRAGYASDPQYAKKLNDIVNGARLRAAEYSRTSKL